MYSPINTCTQMFTHISTRVHSTQCDLDKEQRLEALEAQLSHEVAACEQQAENSMHVLGEGICVPVRVFCQIKGVLEGVLRTRIQGVLEGVLETQIKGVLEGALETQIKGVLEGVLETQIQGVLEGVLETQIQGVLEGALETQIKGVC